MRPARCTLGWRTRAHPIRGQGPPPRRLDPRDRRPATSAPSERIPGATRGVVMVDDRELQLLRREARALQRAVASGDRVAEERAADVLGERAERRFVLADALHVVARENGAASWPALVARARRGRVGTALDEDLDDE